MGLSNLQNKWGRRRDFGLVGIGLASAISLTTGSSIAAMLPGSIAGATNPATLNCGTLEISGTDSHTYQFSEFTTGDAARQNSDAGGSVAYGNNFTATNWTVNGGSPP